MKALPNVAERQLAEVLRRLGRPAFESALWQFFCRCLPPGNIIAMAYRDSASPEILYRQSNSPGVFARIGTVFLGGAYHLDPYHDLQLNHVPPDLYRLTDVAPDALHRSRCYLEYHQQTTLLDELAFIAYPAQDVSMFICPGRDASSSRPFAPREIEVCHRLAPIVIALAEAHWATLPMYPAYRQDVAAQLILALRTAHGIHLSTRQAEVTSPILRSDPTALIAPEA